MIAAHRRLTPATTPTPTPTLRRRLLVLAGSTLVGSTLLAALVPAAARAWGGAGHRIAGRIADDRLSPAARRAVAELLEPGESLASVSSWADQVRRADKYKHTATWHYVNVPITEEKYHPRFEDAKGGVVSQVIRLQKMIADPGLPRAERQDALKFLAHFVEDMHQPVHVGHRDDRGGNDLQVQFFEKGSNLHSVWDSGLLDHSGHYNPATTRNFNTPLPADFAQDYIKSLEDRITPELAAQWSQGTVEDWANESLRAAKTAYLVPGTRNELRKGAKIGQAYQDANFPTAELRLEQAGVRLAALLNAAFP